MPNEHQKMLNICMISSTHSTMHGTRDVRIYWKESLALRDAGNKIRILIMHNGELPEKENDILWDSVPKPGNRFLRVLLSVRLLLKAIGYKCDVFHLYDIEILWFAPLIRIFKPAKKIIYDAREPFEIYISSKPWIPKLLRKPMKVLIKCYERTFSKFCNSVITVAPKNNIKFEKWGRNTKLIGNFPVIYDAIQTKPWKQRERIILCLGQISIRRGLKQILLIAKYLEKNPELGYKIRIIGKYHPKNRDEVESIIEKFPENTLDMRLEWIDYPNAMNEVAKVRFGIFFYDKAFLSQVANTTVNKIYEYMLYGAIPVVTFVPELKQYMQHLKTGVFLTPGKEADDFEKLFGNLQEKGDEISKNTRQLALEKFNWSIEQEKLLSTYSELSISK